MIELTIGILIGLVILAFFCEFIDASIGMGYGTILAPLLVIFGFEPKVVVPAILLSQAVGGISASIFHNKFGNVNMRSKDAEMFLVISGGGVLATIAAAIIAVQIPKTVMSYYIGSLVLVMGIIVLARKNFTFSWKKLIGIGILSAFNKGLSGGGYGPVVTGGQILAGNAVKSSVGITTMAEPPICIAGFISYLIMGKGVEWNIVLALSIGAFLVGPIAAYVTKIMDGNRALKLIGIVMVILGIGTLFRVWNS